MFTQPCSKGTAHSNNSRGGAQGRAVLSGSGCMVEGCGSHGAEAARCDAQSPGQDGHGPGVTETSPTPAGRAPGPPAGRGEEVVGKSARNGLGGGQAGPRWFLLGKPRVQLRSRHVITVTQLAASPWPPGARPRHMSPWASRPFPTRPDLQPGQWGLEGVELPGDRSAGSSSPTGAVHSSPDSGPAPESCPIAGLRPPKPSEAHVAGTLHAGEHAPGVCAPGSQEGQPR